MTLGTTPDSASCTGKDDGTISLAVNGGTAPHTYQWSNGATTQNLLNAIAGVYSVRVEDAMGCTAETGDTIKQPVSLAVSLVDTNGVSCFGYSDGSVDINVMGGTPPYQYLWSNAVSTQDLTGVPAGTYTVIVNDDNGCNATLPEAAMVNSPVMSISAVIVDYNDVRCAGDSDGEITIFVTGAIGSYTSLWNNGMSGETISGLVQGIYSVEVTDSKGCTASASQEIKEPEQLSVSLTSVAVSCYGDGNGQINTSADGGTGQLVYLWNDGSTEMNRSSLDGDTTYSVTVSDANGCTATGTTRVEEPTEISITHSTRAAYCDLTNDGEITLEVSGGTSPYSYKWSDGSLAGNQHAELMAGTYTITVTDNEGCPEIAIVEVSVEEEKCVRIPTAISPNGDGVNDTWEIRNLSVIYPNAKIEVYNRWGELVYKYKAGLQPWDGTLNGSPLPVDSYHYVIDYGDGSKPQLGQITILR
jgi:gliding motility-associated-like protein